MGAMMSQRTDEMSVTTSVTTPDKIAHLVCCIDENTAVCGGPLNGEWVSSDDRVPYCVVCDDLANTHHCPILPQCLGVKE